MESISHVDCAVKQYSSGGTKKTDRASDSIAIGTPYGRTWTGWKDRRTKQSEGYGESLRRRTDIRI